MPAGQNSKLRRLHRRAWLNIVAAVLITQTKTINIDGQQVKVFSFDGRTGFSKACDLESMKLRESVWWPREWTKDDMWSSHNTVPAQQIRQAGFLAACKVTRHGLLMEVDHYGETVIGRVAQPSFNAPGNMAGLRDFLLEHIGESISSIEDLDVDPDQFD